MLWEVVWSKFTATTFSVEKVSSKHQFALFIFVVGSVCKFFGYW